MMKENGFSTHQLREKCGVDSKTIRRLRANDNMETKTLNKLCTVLDPYTWSETAAYLPKLCAKYLTPEELAQRIRQRDDIWNLTNPEIKMVRATEKKSKKIKKDRGDSR